MSKLLPEDNSEIEVVDDARRSPWLTEEQRRQPSPPTKALIDEVIARRDARVRSHAIVTQEDDGRVVSVEYVGPAE